MEWIEIDEQEFNELKKQAVYGKNGAGTDLVFFWCKLSSTPPATIKEIYDLTFLRFDPQFKKYWKRDNLTELSVPAKLST